MEIDNDSNETLNCDEPLTTYAEALRGLNILDKYFLEKGLYSKITSIIDEIHLTLINSKVLLQRSITMYLNK